jgi:hypothetical protein
LLRNAPLRRVMTHNASFCIRADFSCVFCENRLK